jgi:Na+-transporting methylmalonyl-CoA/oxaloacetate decarboxylase gamma subunit
MSSCKNKRGQVGETISWVIATIVIIGVLLIFIYISTLMSKVKQISEIELSVSGSDIKTELLTEKTSLAHQLANNRNKEVIDNILAENG